MTRTLYLENVDWDNDSNAEEVQFEFELVGRVSDPTSRGFVSINAADPKKNLQLGFGGAERKPVLNVVLYNTGSDVSNGDWANIIEPNVTENRISGGAVTTVEEQIVYLTEYINDEGVTRQHRLEGGQWDDNDGSGTDVVVSNVAVDRSSGNPTSARAKISLATGLSI